MPEDAGFFKGDVFDYFRMSESRLFPLENFLDEFVDQIFDLICPFSGKNSGI